MTLRQRLVQDLVTMFALCSLGVALPVAQQVSHSCAVASAQLASVEPAAAPAAIAPCEARLSALRATDLGTRSYCDEGTLIAVEPGRVIPIR